VEEALVAAHERLRAAFALDAGGAAGAPLARRLARLAEVELPMPPPPGEAPRAGRARREPGLQPADLPPMPDLFAPPPLVEPPPRAARRARTVSDS
jgi:hypothetical protein